MNKERIKKRIADIRNALVPTVAYLDEDVPAQNLEEGQDAIKGLRLALERLDALEREEIS